VAEPAASARMTGSERAAGCSAPGPLAQRRRGRCTTLTIAPAPEPIGGAVTHDSNSDPFQIFIEMHPESCYSPFQDGRSSRADRHAGKYPLGEGAQSAPAFAPLPTELGWRAEGRGTQTFRPPVDATSGPSAPPRGRARPRHTARAGRSVAQSASFPDDSPRAAARGAPRPSSVSAAPFFGATRPRASLGRGERQARAFERRA
jgi:hypothetical protein